MSKPPGLTSEGIKFKRGDGQSSETFTEVASVSGFSGLGGGAPAIHDATTLSDAFRRKLVGVRDEGQMSVTLQWHGSDEQFRGMQADRADATLRNFELEFPDGDVAALAGYVLTFEIGAVSDSAVTVNCNIEIDGAVTWAFASSV
jgi:hypothetical protein